MLRIYRRHQAGCDLTSKADPNCPKKVKCPIWIIGSRSDGAKVKPRSLGTRNWTLAARMAMDLEVGDVVETPKTTVREAVDLFVKSKRKRSPETVRKLVALTGKLVDYCEKHNIYNLPELEYPSLVRFRDTWTGADTTQRRDQEILRSLFKFCVKCRFIDRNAASDLDTIKVRTPQTDVFTHDELARIMEAAQRFPDAYGRIDPGLSRQVYAFALVMRYTGLSIGDATGLPVSSVQGNKVMTSRDKTGKEVYVRIPKIVVKALEETPADSERYFFWSGEGKIHTRASKWNTRLQKLFVLANVRVGAREWNAKSLRSRKERPALRPYSDADPRWFRHTLARDLLEHGVSLEELAEILGNTAIICHKFYSKWDLRRQNRIDEKLERIWGDED